MIRLDINNKPMRIFFKYEGTPQQPLKVVKAILSEIPEPVAEGEEKPETVVVAEASTRRHPNDRPDKQKARKLALARLVNNMYPTPKGEDVPYESVKAAKDARTQIWNEYFKIRNQDTPEGSKPKF